MSRRMSYLDTQVAMLEKFCQIETQLDRTLGILLRKAWFNRDDVALSAARDRGIELGKQNVGALCDAIATHEYRPLPPTQLPLAKLLEGRE